jgi:hypothetical protein
LEKVYYRFWKKKLNLINENTFVCFNQVFIIIGFFSYFFSLFTLLYQNWSWFYHYLSIRYCLSRLLLSLWIYILLMIFCCIMNQLNEFSFVYLKIIIIWLNSKKTLPTILNNTKQDSLHRNLSISFFCSQSIFPEDKYCKI